MNRPAPIERRSPVPEPETPDTSTLLGRAAAVRVRRQFAPQLKKLLRRQTSAEGIGFFTLHVGLIIAAAVGNAIAISRFPLAGWALYPFTLFFIGSRFRALGNMLHETSHYILARDRVTNLVLGWLLATIDHTSFDLYIHEHTTHHIHLGDPTRDLDFVTRQKFGFSRQQGNFIRRHLLKPFTLFHLPTYLRPLLFRRADPWYANAMRLGQLVLLAAIGYRFGWLNLLLFYVLPYCTSYQILRYWSDAVDHAGIMAAPDELQRARNHIFELSLLNQLVFPRNDQFHLVHHLFPSVPTRHQPEVHRLLLADQEYAALPHGFSEFLGRSTEPLPVSPVAPLQPPADERTAASPYLGPERRTRG